SLQLFGEGLKYPVTCQVAVQVVDLLEIVQIDEGYRQRFFQLAGAVEFLLQHDMQLATAEYAGQGVQMGLFAQLAGHGREVGGALACQAGVLQFAQVAQRYQLGGMLEQIVQPCGRGEWKVEQGAEFRQHLVDLAQHRLEAWAVHSQCIVYALQSMGAGAVGVIAQPYLGNAAGQGDTALEQVGRLGRWLAVSDGVHQIAWQRPLVAQLCADIGMAAVKRAPLQGQQFVIAGGGGEQGAIAVGPGLQQRQNADVLQQSGKHQLLDAPYAAVLA